jgi:hypothetical protein
MASDPASSVFRQIIARVVIESYVCAFACEHLTHCSADAACASRNESSLSFQQKTHLLIVSKKTPLHLMEAGCDVKA